MTWLAAALGLALLHLSGAALEGLASSTPLRETLRRPAAALMAVAVLGLVSLGLPGLGLLGLFALAAWAACAPQAPAPRGFPWGLFGALSVVVLARPWVPLYWDEYVWLGKARLETLGFGAGARAAQDVSQALVPAGYPPLWPSAVGWLSLGRDGVGVHTLAGSLLVLLCAAAAVDAWAPVLRQARPPRLVVAAALASPLAWVHLRATYVDLPVGLLALALLGRLLEAREGRVPVEALATSVLLVGFKDEGLAHVLAATAAALLVMGRRGAGWRLALPAGLAIAYVLVWRGSLHRAGVIAADHALGAPYWPFVPKLPGLLWRHATDVFSWGAFWVVAAVAVLRRHVGPAARAAGWLLVLDVSFIAVALVCGPERVRAFAENGTLLNRLLLQAWPVAAVAVVLGAAGAAPRAGDAPPVPAPEATSHGAPAARARPRSAPRSPAPTPRRPRPSAAAAPAPSPAR